MATSSSRIGAMGLVDVLVPKVVAALSALICRLEIAVRRVSTNAVSALAMVVVLEVALMSLRIWLMPTASVLSVRLAMSEASADALRIAMELEKYWAWFAVAPVTNEATEGRAVGLDGMLAAMRVTSAPSALAMRSMAFADGAPVALSAGVLSALASTSMAFWMETIFCSNDGSVITCSSGSLSSTEVDDRPSTRATDVRASLTGVPDKTIAVTNVLRGVMG